MTLFNSTLIPTAPSTFGAGLLDTPVRPVDVDVWGNPLPRVDHTAADREWWAQEAADLEAYHLDMARLEEADYLEWVDAMDAWAASGGPITDVDLFPHGVC